MARRKKRELVSQREYARRIGVSQEAVRQAVQSGRISTVAGKIDPVTADAEWERNTDPSKPRNRLTGRPKHRRDPLQPERPMDLGGGSAAGDKGGRIPSYSDARARREVIQAALAKIELDIKLGELVSAKEVRAITFELNRRVRDQLMSLPDRVAAAVAATSDQDEARRILQDEIDLICRELSDAERR